VFSPYGQYNKSNQGLREGVCMRKAVGLLIAMSTLIPAGMIAATPAGAAAGPGCKAITGVATLKPGLPAGKTTVNTTVSIVSHLTGCSGAGGASATATSTTKLTKVNCANFSKAQGASKPATQHIVWAKGQTSTASASLKSKGGLSSTLTSITTAGLYKGTKLTGTLVGTLVGGGCVSKPLSTLDFKSTGKLVYS
jgi:hypothetical protein